MQQVLYSYYYVEMPFGQLPVLEWKGQLLPQVSHCYYMCFLRRLVVEINRLR